MTMQFVSIKRKTANVVVVSTFQVDRTTLSDTRDTHMIMSRDLKVAACFGFFLSPRRDDALKEK